MAVSQKLLKFVVDLVVDDTVRERFYSSDSTGRNQMMSDAGLTEEERQAINQSNADALHELLNIDVSAPVAPKRKAPKRKPSKKGTGSPAKKPTKKKDSKKSAKKASKKR